MSELAMDRIKENLESLKMSNTLNILDNYLESAVKDKVNLVDALDHLLCEEAKSKRSRAYEKAIQTWVSPSRRDSRLSTSPSAFCGQAANRRTGHTSFFGDG
jgi:DNA replication protein DnaC